MNLIKIPVIINLDLDHKYKPCAHTAFWVAGDGDEDTLLLTWDLDAKLAEALATITTQ